MTSTQTRTAVKRTASLGLLVSVCGALAIAGSGTALAGGETSTIDHLTIVKTSPDGTRLDGAEFGIYLPGGDAAEGLGATGFGSSSATAAADARSRSGQTVPNTAATRAAQVRLDAANAAYETVFGPKSSAYLAAAAKTDAAQAEVTKAWAALAAVDDMARTPAQKAQQQKIQDTKDAGYRKASDAFIATNTTIESAQADADQQAQVEHDTVTAAAYADFNDASVQQAQAEIIESNRVTLSAAADAVGVSDSDNDATLAAALAKADTDYNTAFAAADATLADGPQPPSDEAYAANFAARQKAQTDRDAAEKAANDAHTAANADIHDKYGVLYDKLQASTAAANAAIQADVTARGDRYNAATAAADRKLRKAGDVNAAAAVAAKQSATDKNNAAAAAADATFDAQTQALEASLTAGQSDLKVKAAAKVKAAQAAEEVAKTAQNELEADFNGLPTSVQAKISVQGKALLAAEADYAKVRGAKLTTGYADLGTTQRGTIAGNGGGYADIFGQVKNGPGDSDVLRPVTIHVQETKAPAGYRKIEAFDLEFNRGAEKWALVDPASHPGVTVATANAVHNSIGILQSVDVSATVIDQPVGGPAAPAQPGSPAPAAPPAQAPAAPAPATPATPADVPTHISAGGANPTADPTLAAGGALTMLAGIGAFFGIRRRQVSAR